MHKLALTGAIALAVVVPSLAPSPVDAAARVTVAPATAWPGPYGPAPTWFGGPIGEPGAKFAGQCWKVMFGTSTYMGWWDACPKPKR